MALEQISSVLKSTYFNNVSGYDIQYNIEQAEGENVRSVMGTVKKADIRFGYVMVNADGTKNASFDKPIPDEDSKLVYETVLADAKSIFGQRNK